MRGLDANTGRAISGIDHVRQSVRDILTTPVGSRVMRREYGSRLPELLDQPLNEATVMQVYAASVMAITRWEPRIRVTAIRRRVSAEAPGALTLELDAMTREGERLKLGIPLR